MRVGRLRSERTRRGRRISAEVRWDGSDRCATLFFEVESPFEDILCTGVEPFAAATLPLASWEGERRLRVAGSLCPRLADGLEAAARLFHDLHPVPVPVRAEAAEGRAVATPPGEARTAAFLSGGVDALGLLEANRADVPEEHPARIRDGLLVFGLNAFEFDDGRASDRRLESFRRYGDSLADFASDVGVTLVPVYTNVRTLYGGYSSWWYGGFAGGLMASGMAVSRGFSHLLIGSDGLAPMTVTHATHPLLPTLFSSTALTIRQEQLAVSRMEKIRRLAGWKPALSVLRSCLEREVHPGGLPNCGECPKCLRTMVALVAAGGLQRTPTFAPDDLTPEDLSDLSVDSAYERQYAVQCVEPLEEAGREELAAVLRDRIADYEARERRERHPFGRVLETLGLRWPSRP